MRVHALLVLFVLLAVLNIVRPNVIGIDLASEFFKVAIVQPGTPLEIVTNFQSKRKTPVCVSFYKDERHFGSDATALLGRKPELSIAKIYRMMGRDIEHPAIKELKSQYFPYNFIRNESSHPSIQVDDEYYTPEELMAMIFQNVKDITHNFGGKVIKDCVITVPTHFTQHERDAVYTAAEIADLKVLSLIEENTAAALHYGVERTFEQPSVVLYYNMGAGSTQVSVVSYTTHTVKEGSKNKSVTQFEVLGKAWEDGLGGFNFDVRLADMFAVRFNDAWQKKPSGKGMDVRDFIRPMTRLRMEATKVKEILSANAEYPVKSEQLHANVDLSTKVTRQEFEDACSDLFERVTAPIDRALAMANLTVNDIHSVQLLGGAVRMPKIKRLLDEYFKVGNVAVSQHLNGDEAMALGAAFRAANLSTAFRVRKVGMTDISTFGVSINLETLPVVEEVGLLGGLFGKNKETTEEEVVWHKHTSLYPAKSPIPAKTKTVAFLYDRDIVCKIGYDHHQQQQLPAGTNELIASYNITGIAAFAKDTASKQAGSPKVHLSFGMDGSGIVQLLKAEATLEYEEEESVMSTNTAGAVPENATNVEDGTAAASSDANNTSEVVTEKKKKHMLRRVLKVEVNAEKTTPPKWTTEEIKAAKQRLHVLLEADRARQAKAAAMNDLEAYLYRVKNRIMDEEEQLKAISTEEQRQEVVDMANAAEDWLYDKGRDQTVAVYQAKQNELKIKAEILFKRLSEVEAREQAVNKATKTLREVKSQIETWAEKLPQVTDEEKETLLKLVKKAEGWIAEKVAAQSAASPFDQPVFDSSEVAPQLKPIAVMMERLMKKPKPVPPAPEKTSDTSGGSNVTTDGDSNGNESQTQEEDSIRVEREPAAAGQTDKETSDEL